MTTSRPLFYRERDSDLVVVKDVLSRQEHQTHEHEDPEDTYIKICTLLDRGWSPRPAAVEHRCERGASGVEQSFEVTQYPTPGGTRCPGQSRWIV